jgi:hypothetical protein
LYFFYFIIPERPTINQSRNHLAHIIRLPLIWPAHNAVELLGRITGLLHGNFIRRGRRWKWVLFGQTGHDSTGDRQRVAVILGKVVGDTAAPAMQFGAAQFFGTDLEMTGKM